MTRKRLPKAIRRPQVMPAGAATDEEAPGPRSAVSHDTAGAESALSMSSLPIANDPLPAASIHAQSRAVKRRSEARKIVERYKFYAAAGGLVPLPVVSIAGLTAVIMRMVKRLSDLYEVPFERDRTRSIIVGLTGGAVPTGLGAATASTLGFVVPGAVFAGLAVSSITAAAFTRGVGLVFVEHFEDGASSRGATEANHT